jgi:cell shape-determining protein MreD
MKERLMGFLFCGALLAILINYAADKIHARLFADSLWFQAHWYIPYVVVPAASLLVMAFSLGFFRPRTPRWADALALLGTALLVYLTLGGSYSCWQYCF